MSKLTFKDLENKYEDLLSDGFIRLSRVDNDKAEVLSIALKKINETMSGTKIKHIDHKFGNFRISFIGDVVIPKELHSLKEVVFYS